MINQDKTHTTRRYIVLICFLIFCSCGNKSNDTNSKNESRRAKPKDIKEGTYQEFYRGERLKIDGYFQNGKRNKVWIYYSDKSQIIDSVVSYYDDKPISRPDINDFYFINLSIDFDNTSIELSIPEQWIEVKEEYYIYASKKRCDDKTTFCPNFNLTFINNQNNETFEKICEQTMSSLKEAYSDVDIINKAYYIKDSSNVFYMTYKFSKDGMYIGGALGYIEVSEDKLIQYSAMAENINGGFVNYVGLYEKIFNMVRVN